MIISIIIILLAFTWLLYESDFLRVRLSSCETLAEYDARILKELDIEYQQKYQDWLANQYEIKYIPVYQSEVLTFGERLAIDDDNRIKRQSGEMLYQRGFNGYKKHEEQYSI